MEIHTQQTNNILVVALEGELDAYWAEEAERELWACLEQGHYRLVLDLDGLTYLSSAGLRVLLRFHQRITSLGGELHLAAQTLAMKRVDAIVQVSDNVVYAAFDSLVKVADEQRIPLFSNSLDHAEQGATVALGWDFYDNGLKSAELAVRVMEGENPADIPFQGLDKILLHVNLEAADVQGLHIPESVLQRADKVIGQP